MCAVMTAFGERKDSFKVWVMNITNPWEALQGEKVAVQEVSVCSAVVGVVP